MKAVALVSASMFVLSGAASADPSKNEAGRLATAKAAMRMAGSRIAMTGIGIVERESLAVICRPQASVAGGALAFRQAINRRHMVLTLSL